ncbi:YjeF family domain-containing protein, variant 6 [Aphanomyces astaci]|uniref:YjeF family domain-containing protein, variant 6 n=1 Tax=Aphanomyces astaci TaxID=112090 RepID=W4GC26_APHAT|nr:YjeF family domain-containing protein, variant 6 [Aphanomyces astaci]ETV76604.1 YjeF family domain-containing protein, variant 6 [Aphanomyces astaci]|eukprot:XP_009834148.1 YjeF family domain-containing protein, variant 6 [Aphanomyces astaci]
MDARAIVPPLSFDLYKGQYGKVGIVGGCAEYTDLCHIFCTPDAAIPIKCYSPELIVHPYLGTATLGRITAVLPRLDALVLGPGLGRDPDVLSATKSIVAAATELQLPLVLDGDALYLLSTDVLLLRNYTNAILTPNTVETIYYALLVKTSCCTDNGGIGYATLDGVWPTVCGAGVADFARSCGRCGHIPTTSRRSARPCDGASKRQDRRDFRRLH